MNPQFPTTTAAAARKSIVANTTAARKPIVANTPQARQQLFELLRVGAALDVVQQAAEDSEYAAHWEGWRTLYNWQRFDYQYPARAHIEAYVLGHLTTSAYLVAMTNEAARLQAAVERTSAELGGAEKLQDATVGDQLALIALDGEERALFAVVGDRLAMTKG